MQNLIDNQGEVIAALLTAAAIGFVLDTLIYRVWVAWARKRPRGVGLSIARAVHWLPTVTALSVGLYVAGRQLELSAAGLNALDAAIRILLIGTVTLKLGALAGRLVRIYTSREDTVLPSSTIFVNLTRAAVWSIGVLVMLAALSVSITPLLTALGVGGLAVGLALQPTLENLFAGVQVLMSRQIEPGDFVRLETGEEGWVEDVTWRNTTIKMLSNDLMIVPNATVGRSRITNFTSTDEQHGIIVNLSVAYGSDLEFVERVTLDVARAVQTSVENAVPDFDPTVRFCGFGDSAMELRVVLRVTQYSERWAVQHEFIKRLYARYAAENVEIPFPQRTVHLLTESAEE